MSSFEGGQPGVAKGSDRHLWEYRWFRDLAILAVLVLLLVLGWWTRAILLPVVLGLALAYIANPLITGLHRRAKMPRWLTTFSLLLLGLLAWAGGMLYLVPRLLGQAYSLIQRVPAYARTLAQKLQSLLQYSVSLEEPLTTVPPLDTAIPDYASIADPSEAVAPLAQASTALPSPSAPAGNSHLIFGPEGLLQSLANMDLGQLGGTLLKWLGFGVGVVSSALSLGTYLILALAITLICFFYFSWKFDGILAWFGQFVPHEGRTRTLHILGRMDKAIAAWFRGRLVQALLLGCILSVGWGIAGVPYWLILGILGGLLNLIPYMSGLTLPLAILLMLLDAFAQGTPVDLMAILLWPTLVFILAQGIDGWVVEPLVQGQATSLDPLSVLIAVLIGATLAGVLGMILAIPTAACVKILWQEVVRQRVQQIINRPADS